MGRVITLKFYIDIIDRICKFHVKFRSNPSVTFGCTHDFAGSWVSQPRNFGQSEKKTITLLKEFISECIQNSWKFYHIATNKCLLFRLCKRKCNSFFYFLVINKKWRVGKFTPGCWLGIFTPPDAIGLKIEGKI